MFSWLGHLGTIIGGLFHLVTNPLAVVWSWFFNTFIGNPTNPNSPLGFLFQTLTGQIDPTRVSAVPHMYAIMAPMALGAVSIATAARYFKLMKDDQVAPSMALYDVMPRYLILALLLAPGTNIAYHLYGYLVDSITQIGGAVTVGLLSTFTLGHMAGTLASAFETDVLTAVASFVTGAAIPMVSLVVVFGVGMLCLVLYLVVLMVARSVILIFGLVFMPIALPIAAYDTHNAFFRWWLGTVMGALIAQIIGGAGFAITLSLAISAPGQGPLKIISTLLLMDAGLMFTTKAVKAAESGAVGGAGMGVGGLVETLAMAPRAARNLLGTRINSENSGSFTSLGRRLDTGAGGGVGSGGSGGSAGGWSAGRRGIAGFLFPRHNVSADAIGVGLSTMAGAAKGALRPGGDRRSHSLVMGAQRGFHAGMGTSTHEEHAAEFGGHTAEGRQFVRAMDAREQGVEGAMAERHGAILEQAQAESAGRHAFADEAAGGAHDDAVSSWLDTQNRDYSVVGDSHRAEFAVEAHGQADAAYAARAQSVAEEKQAVRQELARIRHNAMAQSHANSLARLHPTALGKSGRLTQDQEAHMEAAYRAMDQKFGVKHSGDN